jgi:putative ABC transport system ATP-binding protein
MADTLINIQRASKHFQQGKLQLPVLAALDFSVARGEFVAIEGRSGSGKSTLLSIIGLLDEFSAGEYLLLGQAVPTLSAYQRSVLRNRHIGWIFQNFNLISHMTVAENVSLPLRYMPGVKASEYPARVAKVLMQVQLDDKMDVYPEQLSGGQQQRVAIARALITEPSLLLADEPTGNLDSQSADIVMTLLTALHRAGATVLMVTHDPQLAARAQRRLFLADGQFVTCHQLASVQKVG